MNDEGIITRRNSPHWYRPGAMHFVTFRLFGTIPLSVLRRLRKQRDEQLKSPPAGLSSGENRVRAHKRFFAAYDRYLDSHRDNCWLAEPAVAKEVQAAIRHYAGQKYELAAYCIMPNHVHVLIQPLEAVAAERSAESTTGDEHPDAKGPLASIMRGLKSYSARQANSVLGRTGPFWQRESYDHWVRSEHELERIEEYIAVNPVNAGLCARPEDWKWSSRGDCAT